jgi:hypothetical protein
MKSRKMFAVIVFAVFALPGGAASAGQLPPNLNPGWLGLDTVSSTPALEIKLGYRVGSNKILYAGLRNIGTNKNAIDVTNLQASATGVSVGMTVSGADSGALFGLGDWCIGSTHAVLPYIKDFNVNVLRYNLGTGTIANLQIPASTSDQYTSTDCFTVNSGSEFAIAANNFDQKRLDYYRSTDTGSNWKLQVSYSIVPDSIIDAFAGGFRDTHGEINDEKIGSTYQRGNGILESVTLDWSGNVLGSAQMGDHSAFVGNGFLKEMDGLQHDGHAVGIANGGTAIAVGLIDLSDGSFDVNLTNNVGTGSVFPFQGVTLSPYGTNADTEFHYFTNQHARISYNGGMGTSVLIDGYPFENNGGPVDSVDSSSLARIFVAGIYQGAGGGPVTAIATLDPATVAANGNPPGGGPAAVPTLDWRALILFGLLLLLIGGLVVRRRLVNS